MSLVRTCTRPQLESPTRSSRDEPAARGRCLTLVHEVGRPRRVHEPRQAPSATAPPSPSHGCTPRQRNELKRNTRRGNGIRRRTRQAPLHTARWMCTAAVRFGGRTLVKSRSRRVQQYYADDGSRFRHRSYNMRGGAPVISCAQVLAMNVVNVRKWCGAPGQMATARVSGVTVRGAACGRGDARGGVRAERCSAAGCP